MRPSAIYLAKVTKVISPNVKAIPANLIDIHMPLLYNDRVHSMQGT